MACRIAARNHRDKGAKCLLPQQEPPNSAQIAPMGRIAPDRPAP
jgi:hypothetical protein